MRRVGPILALAAVLLGGCVYDPYTGTYVPCCNYYGYPYGYGYRYRYPGPYSPYGAPPYGAPPDAYGAPPGQQPGPYEQPGPPPGQPGGYYNQSPGQPGPRPGAAVEPGRGGGLAQRFAAANVTRDGRLTRQQAAQGMPMVARNFNSIDMEHKGYVTWPEVEAFAAQRRPAGNQYSQAPVE